MRARPGLPARGGERVSSCVPAPGRHGVTFESRAPTGAEVEAHQHAVLVRQIADDALHRRRQAADQRRHRDNLNGPGQLRMLHQVDDLNPVASGEMLFADRLEVLPRAADERAVSPARYTAGGSIRPRDGPSRVPFCATFTGPPDALHSCILAGSGAAIAEVERADGRRKVTTCRATSGSSGAVRPVRPGRRRFCSSIHVSMSQETPTSTSLPIPLPGMRCVKSAVTLRPFRKSMSRITMLLISPKVADVR